MASIPLNLQNDELSQYLLEMGLIRISQGKVRDTWSLESILGHNNYLLVVATDRISIFDYVLKRLVPKKGEVLTALTHFWLSILTDYENHLVPSELINGFNFAYDLQKLNFSALPIERCLVVKNLCGKMYPAEMILRGHIGGSVFSEYQNRGKVAGQQLPTQLPKWSKLNPFIFTPSTKAEVGNDINTDIDDFYGLMDYCGLKQEAEGVVVMLLEIYRKVYEYAEQRGILILDTKFEVAGKILADEILTPDSSRFALKEDWKKAMIEGRDPYFHDKQPVRDWGSTVVTPFFDAIGKSIIGFNKLKSSSDRYSDYVYFVHSVDVPDEVINGTTKRYLAIFEMITGNNLRQYQSEKMGVKF